MWSASAHHVFVVPSVDGALLFWSFTSGSPQKHVLGIENPILWCDVRFGCVFPRCVLPKGLAKEPQKMDLGPVEYYIGAPDAEIPRTTM